MSARLKLSLTGLAVLDPARALVAEHRHGAAQGLGGRDVAARVVIRLEAVRNLVGVQAGVGRAGGTVTGGVHDVAAEAGVAVAPDDVVGTGRAAVGSVDLESPVGLALTLVNAHASSKHNWRVHTRFQAKNFGGRGSKDSS